MGGKRRRTNPRKFKYALGIALSTVILSLFDFSLSQSYPSNVKPIGEIISSGDTKYEIRQDIWKSVGAPNFPLFENVRIKTEDSSSILVLSNDSKIELAPDTIVFSPRENQLDVLKGRIEFRIPPKVQMTFKVGQILVVNTQSHEASGKFSSAMNGEAIGSIFISPTGTATVKSIQGIFSILGSDRIEIAVVPSRSILTIPSTTVFGKRREMVSQAVDPKIEKRFAGMEKLSSVEETSRYGNHGGTLPLILNITGMGGLLLKMDEDDPPLCR